MTDRNLAGDGPLLPVSAGVIDGDHLGSVRTAPGPAGDYWQADVFAPSHYEPGMVALSVSHCAPRSRQGTRVMVPAHMLSRLEALLYTAAAKLAERDAADQRAAG